MRHLARARAAAETSTPPRRTPAAALLFALALGCEAPEPSAEDGGALGSDAAVAEDAALPDGGGPDRCGDVRCDRPPPSECDGDDLVVYTTPGVCSEGACEYARRAMPCPRGCASGRCAGDPCAGVTCADPPPSECDDAGDLVTYTTPGVCADGACTYAPSTAACPHGCADGRCTDDPCLGVRCDAPPANHCASASRLRVYDSPGSCTDGTCRYTTRSLHCPFGCEAGRCNGDPCAGVTCASPPASACAGADTLRVYAAAGSCADGACEYPFSSITCEFGCEDGRCVEDPCLGVSCATPPARTCEGADHLRVYERGTCDAGACTYPSTLQYCTFGCSDGRCNPDPCAGVTCATPPTDACSGDTLTVYEPTGVCDAGACTYASSTRTCAYSCDAGACTITGVRVIAALPLGATIRAIGTAGDGRVCVAGRTNTIFPSGPAGGATDGFVACYAASGALLWGERFGGADMDFVEALVVASDGTVYVAGTYRHDPLTVPVHRFNTDDDDVFVARLSADGDVDWLVTINDIGESRVRDLELVPGRGLVLSGNTGAWVRSDASTAWVPYRTSWSGATGDSYQRDTAIIATFDPSTGAMTARVTRMIDRIDAFVANSSLLVGSNGRRVLNVRSDWSTVSTTLSPARDAMSGFEALPDGFLGLARTGSFRHELISIRAGMGITAPMTIDSSVTVPARLALGSSSYVWMSCSETFHIDGQPYRSPYGGSDACLVIGSADGALFDVLPFGGAGDDVALAVHHGGSEVYLAGRFYGPVTLGDATLDAGGGGVSVLFAVPVSAP